MAQGPPGWYTKRYPPVKELTPRTDPPESHAPPGSVVVKAAGAKFTMPVAMISVLVSGILGALGARAIPTPTSQDSRLEQIQQQLISSELKRERDYEERRRQDLALEERIRGLQTEISLIQVQVKALSK